MGLAQEDEVARRIGRIRSFFTQGYISGQHQPQCANTGWE